MKRFVVYILTGLLLTLSGCWDQRELTESGFVLGTAIDQHEDQMELSVQFYHPSPKEEGGEDPFNFNIYSETISEGARNLVNHIGRRANWSHMQTIVIGEDTARTKNLSEVLDFFYREQEPRATTQIAIGQGKGGDYLGVSPLFEGSSGRQFREIQKFSKEVTSHSIETTLLDLALQMKSELGTAVIPYMTKSKRMTETAPVIGVAIIKDDKMIDQLSGIETQSLLMLREQFQRGNIKIPCENGPNNQFDNIEVFLAHSDISPKVNGDSVAVNVSLQIQATLRELVCNEFETVQEIEEFATYIEQIIEGNLMNTIKKLQGNKVDVINLGNKVYRDNPKTWETVKGNWDELFAKGQFVFDISVEVEGSGITNPKPFLKKVE
ncbi:Ger(x)C family spore germination protein [Halalkalibacter kiskunsagensis]|uniref:Ger(X)C family spore germination protein n=1 Tax=Halalkalibacter kiskunsagensis TaxID=1548599 RepID=A0ABV6KHF0_9BACI